MCCRTRSPRPPRAELYDDDVVCEEDGGDLDPQYCYAVYHTPAGTITQPLIHGINRPTFQQAVEVRRSVPREDDGGDGDPEPPGEEPPSGDGGPGRPPGDAADGGGGRGDGPGGGAAESAARAATAGATAGAGQSGDLPFTGLGLAALVLLGAGLLTAGVLLRRGE